MKAYNRALEKRKILNSVKCNTISETHDDKESIYNSRIKRPTSIQRRTFQCDNNDYGKGRDQSGRNCQTSGSTAVQHQQDHATEGSCLIRVSDSDCRESGISGGIKDKEAEVLISLTSRECNSQGEAA